MVHNSMTRELLRTPLYDRHVALGGKMVAFAGYELPAYYTSIIEEHRAVRNAVGIFDVSHLGEIKVKGPQAFPFLQKMIPTDLGRIGDHEVLYTVILNESGGIIDDILIYRLNMGSFYLVVNAARIARVFNHLQTYVPDAVEIANESLSLACVAVQGPEAPPVMKRVFGPEVLKLKYYAFMPFAPWGPSVWISRTGYTGEDGFEVFSDAQKIVRVWDEMRGGLAVRPVGLGARNTLRLEAGNVLNGTDMDETQTPYEARLSWLVSAAKGDFVGRERLLERKLKGFRHKLAGFKLKEKAVAREGCAIWKDGKKIGRVTSGSYSPTLSMSIGLGYVELPWTNPGTEMDIEVHERRVPAEIVRLPFIPLKHL